MISQLDIKKQRKASKKACETYQYLSEEGKEKKLAIWARTI